MRKSNLVLKIIILAVFTLNITSLTKAQWIKPTLAAGLITTNIIGNNLNSVPFFLQDTNSKYPGGNFAGTQPGIGFLFSTGVDELNEYRITIGADLYFFDGRIRGPGMIGIIDSSETYYTPAMSSAKHTLLVLTPTLGINYYFYTLKKWAWIYGGVQIRPSFIFNDNTKESFVPIYDSLKAIYPGVQRDFGGKENAFRLGFSFKLGVEGNIYDRWQINTSISLGTMNIIGQDDSRGELLTPNTAEDLMKENLLWQTYFTLMVQYKL
ncbi:MAG: hypothetical protein HW421_43 [Ignavibacteria bacterium]|nr:hypothetical protein [Ignavibacteria bacterium]